MRFLVFRNRHRPLILPFSTKHFIFPHNRTEFGLDKTAKFAMIVEKT
ncbi:hypothetical protein B4113_1763 [Geobacillus sp. B4113_201601]|nr:hypothetical protein B4113_1763 [Geobacillus sp. B4113_201601]